MLYKISVSISQIIFNLKIVKQQQIQKNSNVAIQHWNQQIFIKFLIKYSLSGSQLYYRFSCLNSLNQKCQKWKFESPKCQFTGLQYQFYIEHQTIAQNTHSVKPSFQIYLFLQRDRKQKDKQVQCKSKKVGYTFIDLNQIAQDKLTQRQDKLIKCKDQQAMLKYQISYYAKQYDQSKMVKDIVSINNHQQPIKRQQQPIQKQRSCLLSEFSQSQIQKQYNRQEFHQELGELESIQNYQRFLTNQIKRLNQQNQKIHQLEQEKQQLIKTNLQLLQDKINRKKQGYLKSQEMHQGMKQKIAEIMNVVNQNCGIQIVQKVETMIMQNEEQQ